jgi:hypothetical protein
MIKPKRKRPSDVNQLAHSVLQDIIALSEKKPAKRKARGRVKTLVRSK